MKILQKQKNFKPSIRQQQKQQQLQKKAMATEEGSISNSRKKQ